MNIPDTECFHLLFGNNVTVLSDSRCLCMSLTGLNNLEVKGQDKSQV